MSINVGMIGLTHPHSDLHLQTLHSLDAVAGVVVWDPDPAAVANAQGRWPKAESSLASLEGVLAREDVPVMVVALPNRDVPEMVVRAARAGKHVLCEKPCARSAAEFLPALAALEKADRRFSPFYLWRRNPAILRMRDLVAQGAMGRITSVEMRLVTTQVRMRDPSHWLFRRQVAGGGILSWLGCHWLDLLRYLTGEEVEQVSAMVGSMGGEVIDVEDVASLSMRLTGGAVAGLYAGYLLAGGRPGYVSPGYDMSIILRGTQGTLRHQADGNRHVVTMESHAPDWETAPRQEFHFLLPEVRAYGGAHGLELVARFIKAAVGDIGESSAVLPGAVDALRVLEILDAAYASAESGRTTAVERTAS
ncbi:MAG: Gfo/Idh/MocA family oxidoreductase [Anaerolineae bacterium]|nr:Gfo/Idh/MocA family oxidoreductase [Anaerolineae bacterium]